MTQHVQHNMIKYSKDKNKHIILCEIVLSNADQTALRSTDDATHNFVTYLNVVEMHCWQRHQCSKYNVNMQ